MMKELKLIQDELLRLWEEAKKAESRNSLLSFEAGLSITARIMKMHRSKEIPSYVYESTIPELKKLVIIVKTGIKELKNKKIEGLTEKFKIILAEIKKIKKQCKVEAKKEKERERIAA